MRSNMRRITFAFTIMVLLALVIGAMGCAEKKTELTPSATPSATPLFLEITQPPDGTQVSNSPVLVVGKTIPDAVVSASVNDYLQIATYTQDGQFSFAVDLEEGPDFIEVISSDPYENQASAIVSVIYNP
jgi:Glucodextranase, domain B